MNKVLPFMVRKGEQKHVTESYVSVPPALVITDEGGNIWTLGFRLGPISGGEYTFNVLCNGIDTHEFANRIEYRKSQIKIMTPNGWKTLQTVKQLPTHVYAIGAKSASIEGPISVQIYFDTRPDLPMLSFSFNPMMGGMEELKDPFICMPGQWLFATASHKDVTVAGYLGERNVREIPIRIGEKL